MTHPPREPETAIPEGLVNAIARFDAACRDWGWQQDQGHVGADIQASMMEHSAVGDALMAAIAKAIHDAVMAERERWEDKVDGLESDLDNAVETAFDRGAKEWTRLNFPARFARLTAPKSEG